MPNTEKERCCGACKFFDHEASDGVGLCANLQAFGISGAVVDVDFVCDYFTERTEDGKDIQDS